MASAAQQEAWLTIGQLADRTGVSAATIRAWEKRHGFPRAHRLSSGHRRYREADAGLVKAVQRERQGGLSLPAAIERALAPAKGEPRSLYGELRSRWPELQPYPILKPAMLALTRAVEDEYLASGQRGLLVGSFERGVHFRQSEQRWRELAEVSRSSYVFADFRRSSSPAGGPVRISLPRDHPLMREWAVVVEAPRFCACFASRERLRAQRGGGRVFDLVWSVDPEVVRAALTESAETIAEVSPALAKPLRADLRRRPLAAPEPMAVTWLTNRMIAYVAVLARRAPRRRRAG